jgi:hypothetical protein
MQSEAGVTSLAQKLFEAHKRACREAGSWIPNLNRSWEALTSNDQLSWEKFAQKCQWIIMEKIQPSKN